MPTKFYIDSELRTVFSEVFGILTEKELSNLRKDVMKDPNFSSDFNQLSDYTGVEKFDVTSDYVVKYAQLEYFGSKSKRAFVAPSDIIYGSVRAYKSWHEHLPSQIEVFRSIEEARTWLGLN